MLAARAVGSIRMPSPATLRSTTARESRDQPPMVVTSVAEGSHLGHPRAGAHGRPVSAPRPPSPGGEKGPRHGAMRDAQAGVPSAGWLRAQLAFKDSMVHGILQFTPSIAFCYVLHRCESRDIRCRESFFRYSISGDARPPARHAADGCLTGSALRRCDPWRIPRRGFVGPAGRDRSRADGAGGRGPDGRRSARPTVGSPGRRERVRGLLVAGFDNDPSAGSPTETLLRLLLPLNDKVQWTSRDVAGSGPPASARSEHFTGPFNR